MSLGRWIFWAACVALLFAASFLYGVTWGFPHNLWRQVGASAGCAVVTLMLVGLVSQVAADWREMKRRDESELQGEIKRHEAQRQYTESSREGLRER
jgi:hypothetical protein